MRITYEINGRLEVESQTIEPQNRYMDVGYSDGHLLEYLSVNRRGINAAIKDELKIYLPTVENKYVDIQFEYGSVLMTGHVSFDILNFIGISADIVTLGLLFKSIIEISIERALRKWMESQSQPVPNIEIQVQPRRTSDRDLHFSLFIITMLLCIIALMLGLIGLAFLDFID